MISKKAQIGKNCIIKENVVIEDDVVIGDNCFLDYGCIIRENVILGDNSYVGPYSILGEYNYDFYQDRTNKKHPLNIGTNAIIRSHNVIYGASVIGAFLQTGHNVTIREKSSIGDHCSIGTLSDIQGNCKIGSYVRCHSNVHIGQTSVIKDYVWIFPYVVLTNDPTPPSETMIGVVVEEFAVIATGSIIMPGITIESDSLVAAGAIVTKDVKANTVVGGNPAKVISTTDRIKNRETGESVYPWRYSFERNMPWAGLGFDKWFKEQI